MNKSTLPQWLLGSSRPGPPSWKVVAVLWDSLSAKQGGDPPCLCDHPQSRSWVGSIFCSQGSWDSSSRGGARQLQCWTQLENPTALSHAGTRGGVSLALWQPGGFLKCWSVLCLLLPRACCSSPLPRACSQEPRRDACGRRGRSLCASL